MVQNTYLLPFATCLALLAAPLGHAQSTDAPGTPDTGILADRPFTPEWDGICAEGAALGEGCDTIRAREIVDAARPPWRAVGRVNSAGSRNRRHCTGTLVGERVVATAAHCLYDRMRNAWMPARSILFAAGYQRGSYAAVSRVQRYVLDPANDPASRDFAADLSQDWALLILQDPIGRETGFVDLRALTPEALWSAELILAGYPSLREHVLSVERDCGGAEYAHGGRLLLQQCAVMAGDSGAPVFAVDGDDLALVAVLSGAVRDGTWLLSGSVPVPVFVDALGKALAPGATPAEPDSLPAAPVADTAPLPPQPAPPPAPVLPPQPPRGR